MIKKAEWKGGGERSRKAEKTPGREPNTKCGLRDGTVSKVYSAAQYGVIDM